MDNLAVDLIAGSGLHCDQTFDAACENCRLRALCLPSALDAEEIAFLETIIEYRRIFPENTVIYHDNQKFSSIYAIISGAVKTYKSYGDDKVSITGCHLPGEIFGFSGVNQSLYATNAMALQHACICEIPFEDLERVCRKLPGLQSRLLHLMSHRIIDYQEHLTHLSNRVTAQKRMAAFLLALAYRSARRGESSTKLLLPMSGQDISNYLGITVETASREFTRLIQEGIITKKQREVNIEDLDGLKAISCSPPETRCLKQST